MAVAGVAVVIIIAMAVVIVTVVVMALSKGFEENPEKSSLRRRKRSPSGLLARDGA